MFKIAEIHGAKDKNSSKTHRAKLAQQSKTLWTDWGSMNTTTHKHIHTHTHTHTHTEEDAKETVIIDTAQLSVAFEQNDFHIHMFFVANSWSPSVVRTPRSVERDRSSEARLLWHGDVNTINDAP